MVLCYKIQQYTEETNWNKTGATADHSSGFYLRVIILDSICFRCGLKTQCGTDERSRTRKYLLKNLPEERIRFEIDLEHSVSEYYRPTIQKNTHRAQTKHNAPNLYNL